MRRTLLFLLLALALLSSVDAQDAADYGLHVPTASEYLAALPAIMAQTETEQKSTRPMQRLVSEEFRSRYDADDFAAVPFDVLYDASPYVLREIGFNLGPTNEYGWQHLLFNAWLRETQPDLASQAVWQFEGYTLEVTPVDFTGDGVDELSAKLQYQSNKYPQYTEYFVLTPNADSPEGYSKLGDAGRWFSGSCSFHSSCGGKGEILRIEDINGDGLPDWVTSRGSCSYGHCGIWMEAYGYQDGQFIDLFRMERPSIQVVSGGVGASSSPASGVWNFQNLDDDDAIEITQIDSVEDNRGCAFTAEQTFDWDGSGGGLANAPTFTGSEMQYTYVPTPMCALRQAHQAMNDLDFASAAEHYETMLASQPAPGLEALWDYARVRLAAAYALTDRIDDAATTLGQIEVDTISDDAIHLMVSAAQTAFSAEPTPVALCAALRNALLGYDSWLGGSILIQYGQNNDYHVPLNYGGGDFSPDNTGCPIYDLWEIAVLQLETDTPLNQQLEARGWHVRAEMELDLNEDGQTDQLAWPKAVNFGVLKLSDGRGDYDISVAHLSSPTDTATINQITLPDDSPALVQIAFDPTIKCRTDRPDQPGSVWIWRLGEDTLKSVFYTAICAPLTLEQLFPVQDELHVVTNAAGDVQVYKWSETEREFNLFPLPTYVTYEGNPDALLSCLNGIYDFCGNFNDPDQAITKLDSILAAPPENASPEMLLTFRYMRAVSLELTERPDEALREYVTIVEEAPDSALGMLAALHLESVR